MPNQNTFDSFSVKSVKHLKSSLQFDQELDWLDTESQHSNEYERKQVSNGMSCYNTTILVSEKKSNSPSNIMH